MKFEIEKKNLLSLLAKTQNIVEKRNTMPVLINVLLEVDQNELKIFATDLEVSLTDHAEVQHPEPGKVAVNAKQLFEIAKELSEGTILFTKKENNWLEIKQSKSVFNIVGISADEYPIFPTYSTRQFTRIPAQILCDMIEKTIYSVSNDETRYHLSGVYFTKMVENGDPKYRMVSTDGHRLSLVDRRTEAAFESVSDGVIIPRKGLQEIRKLLEPMSGECEIAIEGAQLVVRYQTTVLMVRLIEGKYPNYQQLIPQNLLRNVRVRREDLLSSLKRVSLLSNQKSKGVTLVLSPGKMEITSHNPEMGDAKEELEINYQGEEIKIGFNARYILDVLNSFDQDEVCIDFNDQLSPSLMRPSADQSYTCVIMPMRI